MQCQYNRRRKNKTLDCADGNPRQYNATHNLSTSLYPWLVSHPTFLVEGVKRPRHPDFMRIL
jgi:hypothetical protein